MQVDRRRFLTLAAGLSALCAFPSCASVAVMRAVPVNGAVRLRLAEHPALMEPGGHLALRLPAPHGLLYVTASEGGQYAAVSSKCTHRGCTVDVAGQQLVCPCHGSTYDRGGRVLRGPAERDLTRFPAHATADGELIIRIEEAR